jgi:hypothetical protein
MVPTPENKFRGTLLVGPYTSKFLVGIGLQRAAAWLNSCRPEWMEFTPDKFGIRVSVMPNHAMLAWFGVINAGISSFHDPAWDRPNFNKPFDLPAHRELILSYGAQSRKAVLDAAYAQKAIIWIKATGQVMVNENENPWMTCCVGWVLKYRATLEHPSVLRNWVQPRWVVFADDSTWVCRINHTLLAQAGDVEQNPGPVFQYLVGVWMVSYFIVWTLPQVVDILMNYEWSDLVFVGPMLNRKRDACSVQESYIEFWVAADNSRPLWWFVTKHPAASELKTTLLCDLLLYVSGRSEAAYEGPNIVLFGNAITTIVSGFLGMFKIWQFAVLTATTLTITSLCVLLSVCLLIVHRRSCVRVVNKNGSIDVNAMRRRVTAALQHHNKPASTTGHQWLASQRRTVEKVLIEFALNHTARFRDVGGSRTRFPDLGRQKHICCPEDISNDDILRNLKSPEIFDNCMKRGQDCPLKWEIPWAMLSHVDYHMTQSELVRTVTGPTFVINHDFSGRPTKLGVLADRAEASLSYFGNRVTMETDDGTKYQHVFHDWGNEGSVVTDHGAFVYCLLLKHHDTSIYFCYPAEGDYNRTDVNVMPSDGDAALPMINGYNVIKDLELGVYRFDKRAHSFDISANLVEECATSFGACPRDEKYPVALMSFVTARCKSTNVNTSNLDCIVRLIAYVADLRAVSTVYHATCIKGHPVDFRWYDLYRLKALIWLQHRAGASFCLLVSKLFAVKPVRDLTAWTFPKVIIPTYEIYTKQVRSKFLVSETKQFGNDRFQPSPTPAHACSDEHPQCCAGEDSSECDHVPRDKSSQHGTKTVPLVVEQCRGRAGVNVHDGSTRTPAPARRLSAPPEINRHDASVAGRQEESDGNKSGRSIGTDAGVNVPPGTTCNVRQEPCQPDVDTDAKYLRGSTWDIKGDQLVIATDYADGKGTRVVLAEDVSIGLMGLTEPESYACLQWVDAVCTAVSGHGDGDKCAALSKNMCAIASGVWPVGEGRVFDFPRCVVRVGRYDGTDIRHPATYSFSDLDVTVSRKEAGDVAGCARSSDAVRVVKEGPNNTQLPKDRNKFVRDRPKKYQPAQRRDARHARPIH